MNKKIIILTLCYLLASCSTKFAYNNIDWLIHWYIDDYVDLTDQQKLKFDENLDNWLQWHKTQELSKYSAHLENLIQQVSDDTLDYDDIEAHRVVVRQYWFNARSKAADGLVDIASSLSSEQLTNIFIELNRQKEKENKEFEKIKALPPEKRKKRWVKRNEKNMRRWLGRLNEKQKQVVEKYYDEFKPSRDLWFQYEQDYQQALRELFVLYQGHTEFKPRLHNMIVEPQQFRSEELSEVIEYNSRVSQRLMLELYQLSSNKQKRKLVAELNDLREDILSIAS